LNCLGLHFVISKHIKLLLIGLSVLSLSSAAGWSQEAVSASQNGSFEVKADQLWGIDKFETLYISTENQTFLKISKDTTITYANFQLGKLYSVNTFNPLKINLFYRDFNTAIILDNRLADIQRIDFNVLQPYRNVTFISTGADNTLWLYNQDVQILELYDYRSNKTRTKTVPIQDEVLDMKSDYNHCFLLTDKYLYVYSYFGNLESKHPNKGYTDMAFSAANLILRGKSSYFFYSKKQDLIRPIKGIDLLISQFLVTKETLYLYQDNLLYRYQLNTN